MSRYPSGPVITYPWFRCGQQQLPPRCSESYRLNNFISDVVFSELNRVRSQLQQHRQPPSTVTVPVVAPPHLTQQQQQHQNRREMSWNGSAMRLPGRQQEEQQFLLSNLQAQLAYEYYHQMESLGKCPVRCNPTVRQQQQRWNERRLGDLLTPFLFVYVPLLNNVAVPPVSVSPPLASHHHQQQFQQRQPRAATNIMFPTRLANEYLNSMKK